MESKITNHYFPLHRYIRKSMVKVKDTIEEEKEFRDKELEVEEEKFTEELNKGLDI